MTDYSELVKALRYCSTTKGMVYCNVNCKYGWEERSGGCKDILMTDAAAAIEELQAQLEDRTNQDEKDKILEDLRNVPVRPIGPIEPMQIEYLPKRGEWIRVQEVDIPGEMNPAAFKCMCSVCRNEYLFPRIPRYCPDCGSMNTAKMEVQDGNK